ncbi:MAG: magnesium chelatase, partial [Caldithrix sp.]|nr:magnesium chelatase [Caldithrix sp.]
MISKVYSSGLMGIDAFPVEVETHIEGNVPYFGIVGLPDNAVKESRERVVAAIKNSGYRFVHQRRITINLAPADLKKEGSAYDLPIAVGILAAQGDIVPQPFEKLMILGELALDGSIRPIHGSLSIAARAREDGFKGIIVPRQNAREAAMG